MNYHLICMIANNSKLYLKIKKMSSKRNVIFKETPYMLTLPVKVTEYFHISIVLLILGFLLTCWFLL